MVTALTYWSEGEATLSAETLLSSEHARLMES